MKKRTAITIGLLWLLFLLVSISELRIVKAESIYIGPDGTVEGTDKIQREGNVYTLTDDINGSIVVEKDSIIIDGAGYTLQGTGSGRGIFLINCHNVTIKNIEIRNFGFGIHITSRAPYAQSNNHTISGTTITANKLKGICIDWTSNNIIVGNNISYNEDYGIDFTGSNNLLRNNMMDNNKYNFGIRSDSGNNDIDRSNTVNGKPIHYWFDVQDRTVPSDAGYVALINCKNITVQNLQLSHNGQGIILVSTTDSTITQNSITANREEGIGLYRSSRNVISENYIANNARGSWVGSWGRGIGVTDSFENQIIGNNITQNNGWGIRFTGNQRDNLFYHNNFIDNKVQEGLQVSIDKSFGLGLSNTWDNGKEGNYWSDYLTRYPNAKEVDGSGVGDTVFYINENNQDNFPLMYPWGSPPPGTTPPTISIVSPKNKTYTVNNVSLTFTVSEPTSWIGYSLDSQAKVTIAGNTTLTGLSEGSHTLIVYAKDIAGNTGASETVYFSIKTQQSEPFPTTWIVAAIAIITVVGAALLVYFVKVKKTTGKPE